MRDKLASGSARMTSWEMARDFNKNPRSVTYHDMLIELVVHQRVKGNGRAAAKEELFFRRGSTATRGMCAWPQ